MGNGLKMSKLPGIEYSSLRLQSMQKLQAVYSTVEELLSYSEVLPIELQIKLDTFRADIGTALEDQEGANDKEPDDSSQQ